MFLRYFVTVPVPPEHVEACITREAAEWLPVIAGQVAGDGTKLLADLGFDVGPSRVGRQVEITLGEPRHTVGATLLPIRWHAAAASSLFPTLDGQFEIAGLGPGTTQLGISAHYEPPLGVVGKIADRALLHRVAEVTVRDFLERVARRVQPGERRSRPSDETGAQPGPGRHK